MSWGIASPYVRLGAGRELRLQREDVSREFHLALKSSVIFLLLQRRDYRDNVNMRFPGMWATLDHSEAEYKI